MTISSVAKSFFVRRGTTLPLTTPSLRATFIHNMGRRVSASEEAPLARPCSKTIERSEALSVGNL